MPGVYTFIVFNADGTVPLVGAEGLSTASRSALPGLKRIDRVGGIATLSPLRGLRPMRAGRCVTVKQPNPRTSIR